MVEKLQKISESKALIGELNKRFYGKQLPLEKRIIPSGYDSDAYRFGDYVIKLYSPEITQENLELYKEVTDKASFLSHKESWEIHFRYSKESFPFRVNKFGDYQYWKKRDCFVAVSRFVEGIRLEEANDIVDRKEINPALASLNFKLDKILGVNGIDLAPINIRVRQSKEEIILIATDLCAQIGRLKETALQI